MKTMILEQAASALSSAGRCLVMVVQTGMDFGEMTGMQVRDLADLRPIISQETFETLCSHQHVMVRDETLADFDQVQWMMDALERIIPSCSAPVTALLFAQGTLCRIVSSTNYSVPSDIPVATDARKAA